MQAWYQSLPQGALRTDWVYPSRMTYEDLLAQVERLRAENTALKQRLAELEAEKATVAQRLTVLEAALKEALAQLEAARRAGKRQAAPFSRGQPQANPKPPGRKQGHPPAQRPKPSRVDRVVEVKLNRTTCLACGGELGDHRAQVQYQVEVPPVQPVVTQFNIEVARCAQCGQRAQARHPEQTLRCAQGKLSDALGAAGVQVGPRALVLAAEMKHALGVPLRRLRAGPTARSA